MSDKPAVASPLAEPGIGEFGEAEPIRIEMDKRVDLAVSLVVIAVGTVIVYMASGFRVGSFPDPVTSRGLPYFTGAYLIVAGLVLAARRVLTWSRIPGKFTLSEGHEDERSHPASTLRAFAMIGLAVLWAVLLKPVGFLIVTPVIIAVMLRLMEVRSVAKLVAFPVVFTLVMWFAFSVVLGIILPYGPFTGLARSWGLIY